MNSGMERHSQDEKCFIDAVKCYITNFKRENPLFKFEENAVTTDLLLDFCLLRFIHDKYLFSSKMKTLHLVELPGNMLFALILFRHFVMYFDWQWLATFHNPPREFRNGHLQRYRSLSTNDEQQSRADPYRVRNKLFRLDPYRRPLAAPATPAFFPHSQANHQVPQSGFAPVNICSLTNEVLVYLNKLAFNGPLDLLFCKGCTGNDCKNAEFHSQFFLYCLLTSLRNLDGNRSMFIKTFLTGYPIMIKGYYLCLCLFREVYILAPSKNVGCDGMVYLCCIGLKTEYLRKIIHTLETLIIDSIYPSNEKNLNTEPNKNFDSFFENYISTLRQIIENEKIISVLNNRLEQQCLGINKRTEPSHKETTFQHEVEAFFCNSKQN